jgi:hypothetical protein
VAVVRSMIRQLDRGDIIANRPAPTGITSILLAMAPWQTPHL